MQKNIGLAITNIGHIHFKVRGNLIYINASKIIFVYLVYSKHSVHQSFHQSVSQPASQSAKIMPLIHTIS
jgi:hypothetical protein